MHTFKMTKYLPNTSHHNTLQHCTSKNIKNLLLHVSHILLFYKISSIPSNNGCLKEVVWSLSEVSHFIIYGCYRSGHFWRFTIERNHFHFFNYGCLIEMVFLKRFIYNEIASILMHYDHLERCLRRGKGLCKILSLTP